jgi:hypothetical protein
MLGDVDGIEEGGRPARDVEILGKCVAGTQRGEEVAGDQ